MICAQVPSWISESFRILLDWTTDARLWTGILVSTAVFLLIWSRRRLSTHSVTIGIPFGLGSVTFKTTPMERVLAWKLYVQLVTRKAALPFDDDHDLITDIYDSLFELFGITRSLLLDLPTNEYKRPDGLARLMIRVLNDGVRPHLTKWQTAYRRWWQEANTSGENRERTPQEIQQQYPEYRELVADLKKTNTELSKLADELLAIARADARRSPKVKRAAPSRPSLAEPQEAPRVRSTQSDRVPGSADTE